MGHNRKFHMSETVGNRKQELVAWAHWFPTQWEGGRRMGGKSPRIIAAHFSWFLCWLSFKISCLETFPENSKCSVWTFKHHENCTWLHVLWSDETKIKLLGHAANGLLESLKWFMALSHVKYWVMASIHWTDLKLQMYFYIFNLWNIYGNHRL